MKNKQIKTIIKAWQKELKILKDWKIDFVKGGRYIGEVVIDVTTKKALIYGYKNNNEMTIDFIYHELLHICISSIFDVCDKEVRSTRREKEEQFIRDVCRINFKNGN